MAIQQARWISWGGLRYLAVFLICSVAVVSNADEGKFTGTFVTRENGEYAELVLNRDGREYSGAIQLGGLSSNVSSTLRATKKGHDLIGELFEQDGRRYGFEARRRGDYLILEFDDGAMIVFKREQNPES